MSARRDPDRLIHDFIAEGADELHDQVYDAVRAAIEQKRQRAVIGPWRMPALNKYVPFGLGAAAVVVALVVGTQLLPSEPGGTGATPSASPSPSPKPSVAAPSPSAGLPEGSSHALWNDGVAITVTIPAPDWYGEVNDGILIKNDDAGAPEGAGMIVFTGDLYVYGDPCQWKASTQTPASTVDELVAALTAQASRDASAPTDISVDGYAGKSITLHVPDDAVFSDCDEGTFGSWTIPGGADPYRYHQDPGQIDELWILDVGGVLTVIDTAHYKGTPAEHVAEIREIVESATFEVP